MGSTLSVLASVAILRNSFNEFMPPEIRSYMWEFSRRFSNELTIVVKESHDGLNNQLYSALITYLGTKALVSRSSTVRAPHRLTVGKNESMKGLMFGLDNNSEVFDTFNGVVMKWAFYSEYHTTQQFESRWYELKFHKQHIEMVSSKYFQYIIEMAKRIKDHNRVVKFFTTRGGRDGWTHKGINLDHPMTFDTLAMDTDLKQQVMDDLNTFLNGKEYYKKIGKVWKRGYLLYGPPGTGKSSLIAAMANYLNYDIYNLNLSTVSSDSSLEYLLLHMSNRSILVVEDVDCSIVLKNRQAEDPQGDRASFPRPPQVTLSGILNAIDGLLSCCGDERIVVFTTNYKDRIDPALLRAGRMDMHICLSYCTFSTFKQLAATYLEIWQHDLFHQIENLIKEVEVSPAEVAGELMKNKDPDTSLQDLILFLKHKKSEAKLTTAPPPVSNGTVSRQEELHKDSNHETGLSNQCEVKTLKQSKKSDYYVTEELAPVLETIISKHGDISSKCTLRAAQYRTLFLESVCGIIQRLQKAEVENLTQVDLNDMLSIVNDLESVGLEVGWLHHRLDQIAQALLAGENCFQRKSLIDGLI